MLSHCGDHSAVCANTESLCCTPETNVMCQLYLRYTPAHIHTHVHTKAVPQETEADGALEQEA